MSLNGTSHVSVREFTIRTGNDGHAHAGRIHTPDPAAVSNLKRILAQQAAQARPRPQSPQDARKAAILEKARQRKRPAAVEPLPIEPEPKEKIMRSKTNRWNSSELITAEVVEGWAERIRAGESRNQVAKNNELGVSDYTIRRYLEMHGYHRTTGQPTESDAEPKAGPRTGGDKQAPVKPAPSTAAAAPPVKAPAATAAPLAEKALAVASSPNGHAVESAGTAVEAAAPAIDEQMANLRRLLAELPRGKGIKIHGKISIELEF